MEFCPVKIRLVVRYLKPVTKWIGLKKDKPMCLKTASIHVNESGNENDNSVRVEKNT